MRLYELTVRPGEVTDQKNIVRDWLDGLSVRGLAIKYKDKNLVDLRIKNWLKSTEGQELAGKLAQYFEAMTPRQYSLEDLRDQFNIDKHRVEQLIILKIGRAEYKKLVNIKKVAYNGNDVAANDNAKWDPPNLKDGDTRFIINWLHRRIKLGEPVNVSEIERPFRRFCRSKNKPIRTLTAIKTKIYQLRSYFGLMPNLHRPYKRTNP